MNLKKLSESEKVIHSYILSHLDQAVHMTIRELAKETYTSSTTIMRYCHKLGYSGYEDFKIHIVSDIKNIDFDDFIISDKENIVMVMNKIKNLYQQVIDDTQNNLSVHLLNELITKISQIDNIVFICYDANVSICEYISHYLFLTGKICEIYNTRDQQLLLSLNKNYNKSLIFVISRSGKGEHLVKVMKNLYMNKFYVVSIIGQENSVIGKYATQNIHASYDENFSHFGDSVFYTSVKYIFDCLIFSYISKNYANVKNIVHKYNQIFFE